MNTRQSKNRGNDTIPTPMGIAIDGECKVCNLNNTQLQLAKACGGVRGMVVGKAKAKCAVLRSELSSPPGLSQYGIRSMP